MPQHFLGERNKTKREKRELFLNFTIRRRKLFSIWLHFAKGIDETNTEFAFCNLLQHTTNYAIYRLEEKSNCLSHVKSFGSLICLRDGDNQVQDLSITAHVKSQSKMTRLK